ncbi:hypothetical protein FKM82_000893 [Ascaphus truei]
MKWKISTMKSTKLRRNYHLKIMMVDFNTKICVEQKDEGAFGKYGYGNRNTYGDRLVELAECKNSNIMNSFFKKHPNKKWTWNGPNGIKN